MENKIDNINNIPYVKCLPQKVREIISWQCPIVSGAVFTLWILVDIMLRSMSLVSVIAYCGLIVICGSFALRIYSHFLKGEESHPLQKYLDIDINQYLTSLNKSIQKQIDEDDSLLNLQLQRWRLLVSMKDFQLVAKFIVSMIIFMYVGSWFNLQDLVTITFVGIMTLPRLYTLNSEAVDKMVLQVRKKLCESRTALKKSLGNLPIVGGKNKQQ